MAPLPSLMSSCTAMLEMFAGLEELIEHQVGRAAEAGGTAAGQGAGGVVNRNRNHVLVA